MKFRITIIAAGISSMMISAHSGYAQNSGRKISLDEAIDLSIKNSKSLRASQARIQQASANTTISKQDQLPDLKVSGSYLRVTQPNITQAKSSNSGSTPSEPIKVDQAAYAMANLSLPVYQGMKIQYGIRSSEFLEKAASLDADQNKEAVILNTIDAFSNLYKAKGESSGDPGKPGPVQIPGCGLCQPGKKRPAGPQ